ncbi:MAG: MFS transporter, partial [Anaerolineae bacterium]|nr:MFS transporter [Anaerolineae bacterium]
MDNKIYRRRVTAWVMYDWANSAFATTVMAGLLPAFYQTVAGAGLPDGHATAYWGYTVSAALLIAAVISPVLGALSDFRGTKKRFLINFMLMGVCGTALLYFVGTGDWLRASVFFILANVGFAGANVFYDALLPHVARAEEVDQVS